MEANIRPHECDKKKGLKKEEKYRRQGLPKDATMIVHSHWGSHVEKKKKHVTRLCTLFCIQSFLLLFYSSRFINNKEVYLHLCIKKELYGIIFEAFVLCS